MKKIILILFVSLFLVVNVLAQCDSNPVDIREATEQITINIQIPVMENKTILKTYLDKETYLSDATRIRNDILEYYKLEDKSKAIKPVYPKIQDYYKERNTFVQVQKTQTKTKYYIDWANFRIASYTIEIPIYETKTITENRIKKGYSFDEDSGEFYLNCNKQFGSLSIQ